MSLLVKLYPSVAPSLLTDGGRFPASLATAGAVGLFPFDGMAHKVDDLSCPPGQRGSPPIDRRVGTTFLEDVKDGKSNAPDDMPAIYLIAYSRRGFSAEVGDRIEKNGLFRALGQSRTATLGFSETDSSQKPMSLFFICRY
jgi:hypothetical protein